MNERKVKIIKRNDNPELSDHNRKRAEVGLMEIYLREMILKYPDNFKRLCEKLRVELC
jgi:hypothetical protein